jgi:long-subunit fatty acid transport protein
LDLARERSDPVSLFAAEQRMQRKWSALVAGGLFLAATAVRGQQAPVTLEYSLSNPGARSLGFGGAFAALADDATAAFANPAGLVQLSRPEVEVAAPATAPAL